MQRSQLGALGQRQVTTLEPTRHRSRLQATRWARIIAAVKYPRFEGPHRFATGEWRAPLRGAAQPIVYRLRAWHSDGSGPFPIHRAAGIDTDGVLDIGESCNGSGRLVQFLAACKGATAPHRAGLAYSPSWYDFGSVFPLDHLRIEFARLASKQLAEAVDLALL